MKRKKIPSIFKDLIRLRQNNRCACCLEIGTVFHHVIPINLGGELLDLNNVVLLCKQCHKLAHLCDIEIINSINEYMFFLKNLKYPNIYKKGECYD